MLSTLNLGANESWFKEPSLRSQLMQFILSQTALVSLNVLYARLSSAETVDVLQCLCNSTRVTEFKQLNMEFAGNFDSDEACSLLLHLLHTATAFEKLVITW